MHLPIKVNQKGVTILEAVVAMTVIMVSMLAYIRLTGISIASTTFDTDEMVAINLGSNQMDLLSQLNYTDVVSSSEQIDKYSCVTTVETISRNVTKSSGSTLTVATKRVTVTVSWKDQTAKQRHVDFLKELVPYY